MEENKGEIKEKIIELFFSETKENMRIKYENNL